MEKAFNVTGLAKQQQSKKFRKQESLANASEELGKLVTRYNKRRGAQTIAPYLDLTNNCSHSFQIFITGVQKLAQL